MGIHLKELEHRKFGKKVLILKYDLGKKFDVKWLTLKNFLSTNLKNRKNECNMR